MLEKPDLIGVHNFPILRNIECPRAHVVGESDVYCLFGSRRVLPFLSALLVQIYSSMAAECSEIRNVFLLTIHGLVRLHLNALLESNILASFPAVAALNQNWPPTWAPSPDSAISVLAISIMELFVDSAAPFCHCSIGVLK